MSEPFALEHVVLVDEKGGRHLLVVDAWVWIDDHVEMLQTFPDLPVDLPVCQLWPVRGIRRKLFGLQELVKEVVLNLGLLFLKLRLCSLASFLLLLVQPPLQQLVVLLVQIALVLEADLGQSWAWLHAGVAVMESAGRVGQLHHWLSRCPKRWNSLGRLGSTS